MKIGWPPGAAPFAVKGAGVDVASGFDFYFI
jgi:hypothetical protein